MANVGVVGKKLLQPSSKIALDGDVLYRNSGISPALTSSKWIHASGQVMSSGMGNIAKVQPVPTYN